MRNKFALLFVLVLIAGLLSGCAGAASAQALNQAADPSTNPVNRSINVNGSGKVYLTPDIASVNIGVHTENKDAAQAVAENNTKSAEVKDALTGLGIDPKDIQTANFSIYPQQQFMIKTES